MAFQKGQSGNPGGRRKEDPELRELAKKHTREALERLVFWLRSENPKASVQAASVILDRGHGKAQQQINHEGALTLYGAVPIPVEQRDIDTLESAAGAATNGHSPQPN